MNVNLVVIQGERGRRKESTRKKREGRETKERRRKDMREEEGKGGEDSMAVNLTYRLYIRPESTKANIEEPSEWLSR